METTSSPWLDKKRDESDLTWRDLFRSTQLTELGETWEDILLEAMPVRAWLAEHEKQT
jgi:hypothetical protein